MLFNAASGQTHFLNELAYATVEYLRARAEQNGADIDDIAAALFGADGASFATAADAARDDAEADPATLYRYLGDLLNTLDELGLIEPAIR